MFTITKNIEQKNETILTNQIICNNPNIYQSTENNNLSIIESGKNKVAFNTIIQAIKKAKKIICIQSFLIQDSQIIDELILKVKNENVKVYILGSANTRLERIEEDDFIVSDYKNLLETKFKNNFIFRSSENFHGKYILIDPNSKNVKGFLCTNNFTENGFIKNVEITVSLNSEQCEEIFKVFVYHFWEYATHEQNETKIFDFVNPKNHFSLPKLNHLIITSPENEHSTLEKVLLKNIIEAKESISISTYNFEISQDIVKLLIEKSKQNVRVTLFCPLKHNKFEGYKTLSNNGITLILHQNFHAKSLIIDNSISFVFTGNLDTLSMKKNLEIGVQLNTNQTKDLVTIHNHWKQKLHYTFANEISIQKLDSIILFNKEGLKKHDIKNLELIDKTFQPKTVNDIVNFSEYKISKMDNTAKFFSIKLIANISPIEKLKVDFNLKNYCIIENKKDKIVVINNLFTLNDLPKIEKYKNYILAFSK